MLLNTNKAFGVGFCDWLAASWKNNFTLMENRDKHFKEDVNESFKRENRGLENAGKKRPLHVLFSFTLTFSLLT